MSLILERVSKVVGGETHIDDVDVTFEAGSLNILLGWTQAGKTSLMRLMAGLDRPTSGRILIESRDASGAEHQKDVTAVGVRQRNVAMVYQQFINYPSFTVYDNIASPLKLSGLSKEKIRRRVGEVAELMRITPLLERLPAELSGGQQQRTAIARALVKEADLLLLDEPLVNLDYKLREELRAELPQLFKGRDAIVAYATTEPMEALLMGGNTLVLHEGRLLQHGPTVQVYHNPASVTVGRAFSDPPINLMPVEVAGNHLNIGSVSVPLTGHLANLLSGSYQIGVRANHLSVAPTSEQDIALPSCVEIAEISGSETFVHVAHNGVSWVVQEQGVHQLRIGESMTVYVNPRRLFVFAADGHLIVAPPRSGSTASAAA